MIIELKKFGTMLISRPSGKEAWLAFAPKLSEIGEKEKITIDFSGVFVLAPSWADEFLTPLRNNYGNKIKLINSYNASVKATLAILYKK